jgi:CheY-like chemotaxis protein
MARQVSPAVVVTDIRMPGMTGVDLARELKRSPSTREIPIVAVTGSRAVDDDELVSDWFGAILRKPVSPRHLVATVEALAEAA